MTDKTDNGKWLFIINPTAGGGFAKNYVDTVKEKIKQYKVDAEVVLTERRGHATELAESYISKGFRTIVAVGGDGTVNETARAMLDKPDVVLGVVSAGTGNDFAQIPGFSNRFTEQEWETFFNRDAAAMDVGVCNGRIFLNGMGLGFDAQAAAENYSSKNDREIKKGGAHKYIWHIVKTLLFFKERKMTVSSDDGEMETDCFINTIANGRRFAGGFFLTPEAVADDGLLDVCMIKKLNLLQRFAILLKVPKGKHIHDPKVNYYRTGPIRLEFDHEVPHHLDGEIYYASTFDVSVLPGKLKIIYNPRGDHYFNDPRQAG